MSVDVPFYPHHVPGSVYLGTYFEDAGTDQAIPYDLYLCGIVPVARYGEDPPDYLSGLDGPHEALDEVERRARSMGMIP